MTLLSGKIVRLVVLLGFSVPVGAAVRHEPVQPKPGVPVVVSAELAAGTTSAVLKLQAVAPGKYVRKSDPAYEQNWTDLPLRDDGKDGDAKAGDSVFSVRVPETWQKHRWLVRYRIVAKDAAGKAMQWPATDDTCPNFAWWCDAGPAAWAGAIDPRKSPVMQFSPAFLGTLQTFHLLARAEDVAKSQWDGNFHKQKQQGTLVYRGVVYDHIQYSNRGQGSAHISGKNKWGLNFAKGHDLPFVDHNGVAFPDEVKSLNLNPGGSTPYLPTLRGITGLDEVMSMRAYRLAGVPTPPATWVQWRVVTGEHEVSPKDQYAGDLWGVYVVLGEMEPKLLADRKLPKGLTVSTQSGIKEAPKGMPEPQKEWEKFLNGMRSNPKEDWWRQNLDLQTYFSFAAMNRLLGNVDLRPDGNHGYYRHPDGRWAPIPWDNDMMFVPRHHQPGVIDANNCLQHPAIALEYRNRAREILDLFAGDATATGGQVGQLTRDLAAALAPPNHAVDWARLDAAVWNQHPRMNQKGSYFVNPVEGDHFGGRWKRTLATNDFAGFGKYLIDFCTDSRPTKNYAPNDGDQRGYGWGYLAHEAKDDKIPATAKVEQLAGNARQFKATPFASPAGKTTAALEWRVGRVGKIGWYELAEHWRGEVVGGAEVSVPQDVFREPGVYRVRARYRDNTGRCGHWSAAVEVNVKG
ncbi:CotH kinase family protein [Humisphaera borealis]|uniref:CotH kinase family protein n=1 Tax=Humisphaera borealis TaxID=2807512 RepID=A0A7M2X250_9BACT|nr:CotH kinase family protein [Humisphaera borealis]QOV91744.1 CotH kinase family protein [Humisphaera borealis]